MRKRYAVFIAAITFDNQRRILEGIRRRAQETGSDLFVFSCHVNWNESAENKRGAFHIMQLPDIQAFDGVIIVKNTIHYTETADDLLQRVRESGVPSVSIDEHIDGMHNVGIFNYEAEQMVVQHLIRKHGVRMLNYVTGPMNNREAKERWRAYADTLAEHGIACEEERIYHGDFTTESGRDAVEEFLRRDAGLPEAIVFANDIMAVGGIQVLVEKGYRVPEDVLVAGFDNDELAWVNIPSLTTVNRNQEEIGYLAMKSLEGGSQKLTDCKIKPQLVVRESCGCARFEENLVADLRENYCRLATDIHKGEDAVKSMSMELAGLESPAELYEKLKDYIRSADMERFYLCMCDEEEIFSLKEADGEYQLDILKQNDTYTEMVDIPVAYQDGTFSSYGPFASALVLPESCCREYAPSCYVVFPVAYRGQCFGYCVITGSRMAFERELTYSWVVNIGIALENIRKWMLLDQMVKKLNRMWMYDMLTQVYNRMGFYHYSARMLREMKKAKRYAYLLFLDMDGLKKINDTLGHEYGDACISEMAAVLKEALPADALLMRFGGDEFAAFGSCGGKAEGEQVVSAIQAHIAKKNRYPGRSYTLAASIGLSVYHAEEIENLSALIDQADKKMYEEKLRKNQR